MDGRSRLAELLRLWDAHERAIPLAVLKQGLAGLDLSVEDLADAIGFDDRAYRRAAIHSRPHYEAFVMCWRSGQASPIHDHHGSSCVVLVVHGEATETRYRRAASGQLAPVRAESSAAGAVIGCCGGCTHQLANLQAPGEDLVTLHVYSPPPSGWRYHALDETTLAANDRLIQERPATVRVDLAHPAAGPIAPARPSRRKSWKS
ncbi:Cysteine dioxygenase type I [Aquisphaera giovannonii]|uniref:Cysteine dioxygenase type I n=1 Tax=Aquisphaera giovannonii TaxID=406548 RepID=A0A5B9WE24_9BACT|nr:cysteine dioxygenase family protein [Aquisphaera giovannonii]QEH38221.1 Cysteine dioxygenase type I [Aquisphaera giovannonii]